MEFKVGNCYHDENLLSSPFICLDVDPHDGQFEPKFIKWLVENSYKGVLILDDVHLNPPMQKFWNEVTLSKHDITEFGHFSGTGVVLFN